MPADPDTLYGIPRPRRRPENEISNSSSGQFSSQLSSLLSKSRNEDFTHAGRSRTALSVKSKKDDIFTSRKAKKRSAADLAKDDSGRQHQTQDVIGGVDESVLKRSKRKMEEKARIYASMKRGDYVESNKRYINDEERGPLVDFDRKWAEKTDHDAPEAEDDSSEDDSGSDDNELVEYVDEYGRARKGSKAQVARQERQRRIQSNALEELDEMSVRPKMPTNLIYGDAVQVSAFNPDAAIERQMEEIAARRDRSATPPEDTHYDASKEIRSKGVGFYQFSRDNETRKKEMEDLGEQRKQTETWEEERRQNREKKEQDMDESRRKDQERRSERDANAFLKTLGSSLGSFVAAGASADDGTNQKKKKKGWGK